MTQQIRLVLVDDEQPVRRGLRLRLEMEPDIAVVGEAADGRSALGVVAELDPDVVLMDIHMPELDGIAATAELTANHARCGVVMLSLRDDRETRLRAWNAGAAGFVAKHDMDAVLTAAIRAAAHRDTTAKGGAD